MCSWMQPLVRLYIGPMHESENRVYIVSHSCNLVILIYSIESQPGKTGEVCVKKSLETTSEPDSEEGMWVL